MKNKLCCSEEVSIFETDQGSEISPVLGLCGRLLHTACTYLAGPRSQVIALVNNVVCFLVLTCTFRNVPVHGGTPPVLAP